MKEILLIRHGQSTGNAGIPTQDHMSMPLTSLGREQAAALADKLPFDPELIVSSPFRRAWETAAPVSARFPLVPMELWPEVHEFTYLSPESCKWTTAEERRPRVKAYWAKLDPDYIDGDDAESFRDVLSRADAALSHIAGRSERRIFIFTHEQFIKCFLLTINEKDLPVEEKMKKFLELPYIRNCETVPIKLDI